MSFISFKKWINEIDANLYQADMYKETHDAWEELYDEGVTVLFPGGFKPSTAGHIDLIRRYSEHPFVKEVKVLIGPGIRNGIDQSLALKIAEELLSSFDNVSIEAVKYPSPILTAYKYIETAEPGNYAMAAAKKGKDDKDYKRVIDFTKSLNPGGKYYNSKPEDVKVLELPVDAKTLNYSDRTDEKNGEPISASTLRQDILNDDFYNFETNYPGYSEYTTRELWKMLKPVVVEGLEEEYNEELYD